MEATGTVGALGVAGDVATASIALAGLVLVFLGTISTSFDSYQKAEQNVVRGRYQRRAWFAFVGFALALISGALAIAGKWFGVQCAALAGTVILFVALAWVLVASLFVVMDIK